MATEHFKEGTVTYSQSSDLVTLTEKWLIYYFGAFGAKRMGELEDDLCGEPGVAEIMENPLGRWRSSPFYPALARLVDKNIVHFRKDAEDDIWYGLAKTD